MKKNKIQIRENLYYYLEDMFDGDVIKMIENLKIMLDKFPTYTKLKIDHESGYNGSIEYILCGHREETDEEFEIRMFNEKAKKERFELFKKEEAAKEAALYEKLKAKYETEKT